jgi:hypothetical protein
MLALPGVSPRSVPLRDLSAAAIYPPQRSIRRSDLSAAAIYPPQRSIRRSDLSAAATYPPQRVPCTHPHTPSCSPATHHAACLFGRRPRRLVASRWCALAAASRGFHRVLPPVCRHRLCRTEPEPPCRQAHDTSALFGLATRQRLHACASAVWVSGLWSGG